MPYIGAKIWSAKIYEKSSELSYPKYMEVNN
jgi:hypothetical protein